MTVCDNDRSLWCNMVVLYQAMSAGCQPCSNYDISDPKRCLHLQNTSNSEQPLSLSWGCWWAFPLLAAASQQRHDVCCNGGTPVQQVGRLFTPSQDGVFVGQGDADGGEGKSPTLETPPAAIFQLRTTTSLQVLLLDVELGGHLSKVTIVSLCGCCRTMSL